MQIARIGVDLAKYVFESHGVDCQGKTVLRKRGDRYLRTLLIHGARAVLGRAGEKQDPRSLWLGKMRQRRHPNIVAVVLANKNARIAWSLLTSDSVYDAGLPVRAA